MISKKDTSEWFIFYEGLVDELKDHFAAGGTVDDLNGEAGRQSALYHCINEYDGSDQTWECFTVMLNHGATMSESDWQLVMLSSREPHIQEMVNRDLIPSHVYKQFWTPPKGVLKGDALPFKPCA